MGAARLKKKKPATRLAGKSREVELKLELDSDGMSLLLGHPVFAQARPLAERGGSLHAVYYDTDEFALRRAGLSVRVRRQNGHYTQTIKAERKHRSLALDRSEWECAVDGELDVAAAADTPLAPFVSGTSASEKVHPVFTVDTDRKAYEVERNGTTMELALDRVKVVAGHRSVRFCEVELELKKGDASALFAVARDLSEAAPLRLTPVTKSERGYALLDGIAAKPVSADEIDLPPKTSCAESFQIIARSCLSQVVRNEALLRRHQDPEILHQMRVGLRRLNAANSLFKSMLSSRESRAVKADLRWAGKQLGAVRDLDVFLGELRKSTLSAPNDVWLEEAERRRSEAYEVLLKTLEKPRFTAAILHTAAWIESGKWLTRKKCAIRVARRLTVEELAGLELSRHWKRIRKSAKRIAELDFDERHRLRMRIKKLRYGAEFFASSFADGPAKKRRRSLLAILRRLQDLLGDMNDIVVGEALVLTRGQQKPARAERRLKKLHSDAEAACGKLLEAEPFWLSRE
ncbi:CYTH and CHAD domain-containing protein [Microvirga alba]|uniref:CHAD domain-containing protein n=1 Tax=Microvirga alba TaxID=2791025 RepID=A0A931FRF7_9HYPH|nr:CYTH and CHAD domain-containing protein [Microvirga alba]MBF9234503.1 CHAD domain-containing protein [Microvirga alba]